MPKIVDDTCLAPESLDTLDFFWEGTTYDFAAVVPCQGTATPNVSMVTEVLGGAAQCLYKATKADILSTDLALIIGKVGKGRVILRDLHPWVYKR